MVRRRGRGAAGEPRDTRVAWARSLRFGGRTRPRRAPALVSTRAGRPQRLAKPSWDACPVMVGGSQRCLSGCAPSCGGGDMRRLCAGERPASDRSGRGRRGQPTQIDRRRTSRDGGVGLWTTGSRVASLRLALELRGRKGSSKMQIPRQSRPRRRRPRCLDCMAVSIIRSATITAWRKAGAAGKRFASMRYKKCSDCG
jgi:hypothetical protein